MEKDKEWDKLLKEMLEGLGMGSRIEEARYIRRGRKDINAENFDT